MSLLNSVDLMFFVITSPRLLVVGHPSVSAIWDTSSRAQYDRNGPQDFYPHAGLGHFWGHPQVIPPTLVLSNPRGLTTQATFQELCPTDHLFPAMATRHGHPCDSTSMVALLVQQRPMSWGLKNGFWFVGVLQRELLSKLVCFVMNP